MSDKIRDENIDYLFKAILSLKDERECYNFFEDLCTVSEIKEMSKRLLAARLLADNCICFLVTRVVCLFSYLIFIEKDSSKNESWSP